MLLEQQGKEVTETGSPELQDKPAHQNHVVLRENHITGTRTAQSMPFVPPNLSDSPDIPRCNTDSVVHRKAHDRSVLTHDPRLIQNRVDLITDALQEAEGGCGQTEPLDSRAAAVEMYANQSLEECRDIIITWARELRNQYEVRDIIITWARELRNQCEVRDIIITWARELRNQCEVRVIIITWARELRNQYEGRDIIITWARELRNQCEVRDIIITWARVLRNQCEVRDIIITWARELRNQYEPANEREETDENKNVDQENVEDFSRHSLEKTDQGKEWNLEQCEVILKEWASELRSVTESCGLAQAESCGLDQLAVEKWTGELLCTVCPVIEFIMKALLEKSLLVDVTLDPYTAHPSLILSEDEKQVRLGGTRQTLPDNPQRFDPVVNVLGRQGFTSGRHYWQVDVGEKTKWELGVARESINRKGKITRSLKNGLWIMWLRDGEYTALASPSITLPLSVKPRKVGMYLDYEEGQLSFYNVETRSHIYTFTDTFTEKLYPYFNPSLNKDVNTTVKKASSFNWAAVVIAVLWILSVSVTLGVIFHRNAEYASLFQEYSDLQHQLKNYTNMTVHRNAEYASLFQEYSDLQNQLKNYTDMTVWKWILDAAADVTLDPETAHPSLILSEDRKQVRLGDTRQSLPDNPKRFDPVVSVLGRQGFTSGRHYWQVEVGEKTAWELGVARDSINRKGAIQLNPNNGYWTVWLRDGEYKALADPSIPLPLSLKPQKVGVYLDYEEG
ncbi:UNVERIFIED_CONTAM: hypothetical protein FKN15_035575 [Acipenser sinensis]